MDFIDLIPFYIGELLTWLKPFLLIGFAYLCISKLISRINGNTQRRA